MSPRIFFQQAVFSLGFLALGSTFPLHANEGNAADIEFFEKNIRPIFARHCYECHGSAKQENGLRWDRKLVAFKGGISGPALQPGAPDQSRLIQAVRRQGDLKMPPRQPLAAEQINLLEEWVRRGAPWPEDAPGAGLNPAEQIEEMRRSHWAFQPIRKPPVPQVRQTDRVQNPVDAFILAKLEEKKLSLNPPADRATLIRRVYFDLIGLPPTYEQVRAFEQNSAPDAFAKVVDELLAKPEYGQRWGRHWLDVARYSDTKGYVFQQDIRYPFAYTYRDYVIDAFNRDKPYNQFILEQLAADRLDTSKDPAPLAAMGFLTVGQRFLNRMHDIVDDRIDLISRGLLGLTAACSRCHDHKYDPIPTADYYSLFGVFASSREPELENMPLLGEPAPSPEYDAFKQELAMRQKAVEDYVQETHQNITREIRRHAGDYLDHLVKKSPQHGAGQRDVPLNGPRIELRRGIVDRWQSHLDRLAKDAPADPVFGLWIRLIELKSEGFEEAAAGVLKDEALIAAANPRLAGALAAQPLKNMAEVAKIYGQVLEESFDRADKNQPPIDEADAAIRQAILAENSPLTPSLEDARGRRLFKRNEREHLQGLERQIAALNADSPGAPARAMVLLDQDKPQEPHILLRGDPGRRGDRVPRRFLQVLSDADGGKPFPADSSGRLELAQAIVSPTNPLTRRVWVNRVWTWHFGRGLVTTPSDFGVRTPQPVHHELLDWLAANFAEQGWSTKQLHRTILLSSVYQQASTDRPQAAAIDPENDLWWRVPRKRLELEPLRDSLLAVAGRLNTRLGGRPDHLLGSTRRSVYATVNRYELPGVFRAFDFADPESSSPGRPLTTVPQQALFLMNHPFVAEQAGHLARQIEPVEPLEAGVQMAYRRVLSRDPQAHEITLARQFIQGSESENPAEPPPVIWQFGYGRYDAGAGRVATFTPLPHWTGSAWQGGVNLPDTKLGWLTLNERGGHPGGNADLSVIRRWIAPEAGRFDLRGTLNHPEKTNGDGVQAWAVSSRSGLLGEWIAKGQEVRTRADGFEVQAGDTIDFVIGCRENEGWDSFDWTVSIRPAGARDARWESASGFQQQNRNTRPTPVSRWQQYVQVLMLSNEFAFVD